MTHENLQNINNKIEEEDGTTFLYGGSITVVENGEYKLSKEITDSDSGIGSRESSPRNANTIDGNSKIMTPSTIINDKSNSLSSPECTSSIVDEYEDSLQSSTNFIGAQLPPSRNVSTRRSSSETKVISDGLNNVKLQESPTQVNCMVRQKNVMKHPSPSNALIKLPLVLKFKKIRRENGKTEVIIKNNTASIVDVYVNSSEDSSDGKKRLLSYDCQRNIRFPILNKGKVKNTFEGCSYNPLRHGHGAPLTNSANDCFMNSVLQVFTHIPQLARMIHENHPEDGCTDNECVWCILRSHIIRATTTEKAFSSLAMKKIVGRYFSRNSDDQQDAHEFFQCVLNDLERIITRTPLTGAVQPSPLNAPSNAVEQVLSGMLRHEISCPECHKVRVNYERYRELNLDVIAKEREKINCNLSTVLNMNFRETPLELYKCSSCKVVVTASKKSTLLRTPQLLIVQIKRFFCYPKKIAATIKIEKDLDLTPFLYCNSGTSAKYKLEGAIEHFGSTIAFGHYTATCKGFDRKTWYHFDDFKVREKPNIGDSTDSYVVIYSLVNGEETTRRLLEAEKIKIPVDFRTNIQTIPETIYDPESAHFESEYEAKLLRERLESNKALKRPKPTDEFTHSHSVPTKMPKLEEEGELEDENLLSTHLRASSETMIEDRCSTSTMLTQKIFNDGTTSKVITPKSPWKPKGVSKVNHTIKKTTSNQSTFKNPNGLGTITTKNYNSSYRK
uniref:Ubiquitin carboxyl-terminal hydrolase 36 n=1 Tax=Parastrongyloides trichosuri TaxID=131310 RepID=A0A0N4Z4B9_PARTI